MGKKMFEQLKMKSYLILSHSDLGEYYKSYKAQNSSLTANKEISIQKMSVAFSQEV